MNPLDAKPVTSVVRLRLTVHGAVQGVGFRPFTYRLANEMGLTGWVSNSAQGVFIEIEGGRGSLEKFHHRLATEHPPRSVIQGCECSWLDALGFSGFEIRASETFGGRSAIVLPDLATCPECLAEILDPANRRYRYPFTNCTSCGPRFSIIEALPYDRANTSMKMFRMCPACQTEYDDPGDRRFHAQPNACPACGPQLELWTPGSTEVPAQRDDALRMAARAIRSGQIVAVKGVGGFHLIADARDDSVVRRLRARKHREEKPFAVMFPSLESVKDSCEVKPLEARLLQSPEGPIVLLKRRRMTENDRCERPIADSVAPGNPNLGVMLPSNPLHHLLMAELKFPAVATSGNLSDEPICTVECEAQDRLRNIADLFLVHDRAIVRHMDDSIVRIMLDREMILRRARGYAPLPIRVEANEPARTILAVGGHLKNTVALAVGKQVFLSQHIGDLETEVAHQAFRQTMADLPKLYAAEPEFLAADLHPDYRPTKVAFQSRPSGVIQVQHHIAHVLSCLEENDVTLPALGVAWDGTGYGTDGIVWGGECFLVTDESIERVASLRPFRLPGGDAAVKEPRRAALGLLHELTASADASLLGHMQQKVAGMFSETEFRVLQSSLACGLNAPFCSSIGRLFDAVAALVGLRSVMSFEGQAAMELEFSLTGNKTDECYDFPLVARDATARLDWVPMINAMLADLRQRVSVADISAKFHHALAEGILAVAKAHGTLRVALSGGCFQNRYLTERTVTRLREEGFLPYWHQRVPTGDGGIALGQVIGARRNMRLSGVNSHPTN